MPMSSEMSYHFLFVASFKAIFLTCDFIPFLFCYFNHVHSSIAPGQGQATPERQTFKASRKALSHTLQSFNYATNYNTDLVITRPGLGPQMIIFPYFYYKIIPLQHSSLITWFNSIDPKPGVIKVLPCSHLVVTF